MGKAKQKAKKSKQKVTRERLTPKQRLLMEYLLNPDNRHKNVTQICEALAISRQMYYEAMERPAFQKAYEKMSVDMTRHAVGPVINSAIREAVRGSLGHQELVLSMAGVLPEKGKSVKVEAPGDGSVKVEVDLL